MDLFDFLLKQFLFCYNFLLNEEFLVYSNGLTSIFRNYPKVYIRLFYLLYLLRQLTLIQYKSNFDKVYYEKLVYIFKFIEEFYNKNVLLLKKNTNNMQMQFSYFINGFIFDILEIFDILKLDKFYLKFNINMNEYFLISYDFFIQFFFYNISDFHKLINPEQKLIKNPSLDFYYEEFNVYFSFLKLNNLIIDRFYYFYFFHIFFELQLRLFFFKYISLSDILEDLGKFVSNFFVNIFYNDFFFNYFLKKMFLYSNNLQHYQFCNIIKKDIFCLNISDFTLNLLQYDIFLKDRIFVLHGSIKFLNFVIFNFLNSLYCVKLLISIFVESSYYFLITYRIYLFLLHLFNDFKLSIKNDFDLKICIFFNESILKVYNFMFNYFNFLPLSFRAVSYFPMFLLEKNQYLSINCVELKNNNQFICYFDNRLVLDAIKKNLLFFLQFNIGFFQLNVSIDNLSVYINNSVFFDEINNMLILFEKNISIFSISNLLFIDYYFLYFFYVELLRFDCIFSNLVTEDYILLISKYKQYNVDLFFNLYKDIIHLIRKIISYALFL